MILHSGKSKVFDIGISSFVFDGEITCDKDGEDLRFKGSFYEIDEYWNEILNRNVELEPYELTDLLGIDVWSEVAQYPFDMACSFRDLI